MNTGRQRRPSQLPCLPAQRNPVKHLLEVDLHGPGHVPQAVHLLRNMSILDSHPLRKLHAGQTGLSTGGADAETEETTPAGAAQFGNTGGGRGRNIP